ncbi:hypothetical protein SAMN05660297_02725 [Natronincola peptidivorans]|uniref:Uncharacterized protein n=1 Tax=Natronincola peptidivorans TaxID=426128 RepID=A0A1I0FAC6_9FIRM|nr:hypothetical protein [Natronincola peptidivorans]SET54880.1 hypothetical protein SAMN05660297_02725 [Natronincola peptidivorans]
MDNIQDKSNITSQLNELERNVDKSKEYLSALEMLMVDDNNGRLKDTGLSNELQQLNNAISSISKNIQTLKNKIDT